MKRQYRQQHRAKRQSQEAELKAQLQDFRSQNQKLRRENARLRREVEKLEVHVYEEDDFELEPIPKKAPAAEAKCQECGSGALKRFTTPTRKLVICQDCHWRTTE